MHTDLWRGFRPTTLRGWTACRFNGVRGNTWRRLKAVAEHDNDDGYSTFWAASPDLDIQAAEGAARLALLKIVGESSGDS